MLIKQVIEIRNDMPPPCRWQFDGLVYNVHVAMPPINYNANVLFIIQIRNSSNVQHS